MTRESGERRLSCSKGLCITSVLLHLVAKVDKTQHLVAALPTLSSESATKHTVPIHVIHYFNNFLQCTHVPQMKTLMEKEDMHSCSQTEQTLFANYSQHICTLLAPLSLYTALTLCPKVSLDEPCHHDYCSGQCVWWRLEAVSLIMHTFVSLLSDNPLLCTKVSVTVSVLDVNEFPPEVAIPADTFVCENSRVGQVNCLLTSYCEMAMVSPTIHLFLCYLHLLYQILHQLIKIQSFIYLRLNLS